MDRPPDMFDREEEWAALDRFFGSERPAPSLAVVSGRRRQGKSFLLDAAVQARGGVYLPASEATAAEALRRLGEQLARHLDAPAPLALPDWPAAVETLLGLGRERATPVVLDEFPYLVRAVPELPSLLQAALGPRRTDSRTRLVLCGSAQSFMGRLLSGAAPLRGRASLELIVRPFDYRAAAEFWSLRDPRLAMRVHAVVGGTPAYRREYVDDDAPTGLADFDDWVVRTVLAPSSPLFREARYLLAVEPDLRDTAVYTAVLAAVALGNRTRSGIASYVGRPATDLSHHLTVLLDSGYLVRLEDAFRPGRSTYHVAEPLIAFYAAVMRPEWEQLERRGRSASVWSEAEQRFASAVLGPHFESLCREWVAQHAAVSTLGGGPARVSAGVVSDPVARRSHEVDVVALDSSGDVLALGEAKWGEVMGVGHLERLRHVRELLVRGGRAGAATARLLCFSGAGFSSALGAAAQCGEVALVDLERLYVGS